MAEHKGWIGVDLDGTLAMYDGWKGHTHVGEPIPLMLARVKAWLAEGQTVRIFTARVAVRNWRERIRICEPIWVWCDKHLGKRLDVTNEKDMAMIQLWDDRCVQIIPNTGIRADSIGVAAVQE